MWFLSEIKPKLRAESSRVSNINININICSIELKWDDKKLNMIWQRDEMNTNNGVKWRRFIVPKKVEQINDHLFIDIYKSNKMKIEWELIRWMTSRTSELHELCGRPMMRNIRLFYEDEWHCFNKRHSYFSGTRWPEVYWAFVLIHAIL